MCPLGLYDGGDGGTKGVWPTEIKQDPSGITSTFGRPGRGLLSWVVTTSAGKLAYREVTTWPDSIASADNNDVWVEFDFEIVALPVGGNPRVLLIYGSGGTLLCAVYLTTAGVMGMTVTDDAAANQTVAQTSALSTGRWYRALIHWKHSSADGVLDGGGELFIDDAVVASDFNYDVWTNRRALGAVRLGCASNAQNAFVMKFDNVYISRNQRPTREIIATGPPAVVVQGLPVYFGAMGVQHRHGDHLITGAA